MNINKYVGIPYSLRPVDGFLNCWQLVSLVYRNELSKDIPGFSANDIADISNAFTAAFATGDHGFSVVDEPKDFDVVVFVSERRKRNRFHCGIMYNGKVLHAFNKFGQVVYHSLAEASDSFERVEFWRR